MEMKVRYPHKNSISRLLKENAKWAPYGWTACKVEFLFNL